MISRQAYFELQIALWIDEGLDLVGARDMAQLMTGLAFANPATLQHEHQLDHDEEREGTYR